MTSLVLVEERDPWDKLPRESGKAFAAFAHYRDTDPALRSLTNTARHVHETTGKTSQLETTRQTIAVWSRKHRWQERVEQFDIAEDRRRRAELDARRREVDEMTESAGRTLIVTALSRLRGAQARNNRPAVVAIDPNELEPADAARYAETGARLARLGVGLPTDLSRGVDSFSLSEVQSMMSDVIDFALGRMREEQHEPFLREVRERLRKPR